MPERWARFETDTRLLRFAMQAGWVRPQDPAGREMLADIARCSADELRYRSAGLVPSRTTPLPPCDCPDGPNAA